MRPEGRVREAGGTRLGWRGARVAGGWRRRTHILDLTNRLAVSERVEKDIWEIVASPFIFPHQPRPKPNEVRVRGRGAAASARQLVV